MLEAVIEELKLVYNKKQAVLQKSQKLWQVQRRLITSFIEVSMVEGKVYQCIGAVVDVNF